LRSQSWEYCLSTHFLPAQLAAGSGATRFGLVVTDFTLHRYWVQPHVREYFVGTPDLAESVRHRVSGALAEPTGIPVDPAFGSVCPRESRAALGLSETDRVVLVMSGGFGLGTDEGAEAALSLAGADVRVLAVCGANVESRERLDALAARDRRLIVRGYVDDVERYMAAADVIVTKPGGLSLSEALAVGRPMVLTRPLPGHEEANARMLERAGAALLARSRNDVRGALDRMLDDPGLRMRMTVPVRAGHV
jgi:processive 1,2-diacylglycerol beta-glucosyltransferase